MKNNPWKPTHSIIFVDIDDGWEEWVVMLADNGAAYTADEWRTCTQADWELVNGEWLFQGEAAPGPGTVNVTRIGGDE